MKTLSKIALAAMAVLLVGSVVCYHERMFADTAFIGFSIINNQEFAIQHGRNGAFISQLIPMLGAKLHLPLKALLIGYSVGFNLFFFAVAAVLVYAYRQYKLAILMALYYVLFITHSYYWACTEVSLAIAWMFLLLGTLLYFGKRKIHPAITLVPFVLLAYCTISTHLITLIPTAFLWLYFILDKDEWPYSLKQSILFTAVLAAVVAVRSLSTAASHHPYENSIVHDVTHFSIADIIHTFSSPVVTTFFNRVATIYWPAIPVFIAGIIALFRQGKKLLAVYSIVAVLGYIVIMGLAYGNLDNNVLLFHIEAEWASLAVIAAAPFVTAFLPAINARMAVVALSLLFVVRFLYIGNACSLFHWRVTFEQKVLAEMRKKGISKMAIVETAELREKLMLTWALPEETMLLSAEAGEMPQRTFFLVNPDDKDALQTAADPKMFKSAFGPIDKRGLNATYFAIDTTTPYKVVTYAELFK
ncbi:MAG: hypothetical protein V4649_04540 [Bacteroidota bacterium]